MIGLLLLAQLVTHAEPTRFELPNGLRVWVQEDHSRPVALVQITYKVGSLNEGPGTTGIAHYVEHMVYRATENVRNEDVYGYIDRIGGRYTGGTWPDMTRYAETVPSWALESALRVTAERMTKALFDSLEFERERSNVVTEANGFRDADAASALRDAVMMTSFVLHPYRYSSNTWARDNLSLTRAEAYAWYKRFYGPNNAVLVVVGDVRVDDVRRLVTKHFAGLARAAEHGRITIVEPAQTAEKRVMMAFAGVTNRMEVVYRAPSAFDVDHPRLIATDRALRPGLARIARETGAEITTRDTATSYPHVYRISVTADTSVDLEKVLAAIDREIDGVGRDAARSPIAPTASDSAGTRGSEAPNANFPARQSNLTRIADQLAAREALPWEVTERLRDSLRRAADAVTATDIRLFADQWLRRSQRTIGMLVPGPHRYASEVIDVPALRTPPAKRFRPEPVPEQALRPLTPLRIERARRVLPNGVPVRVARGKSPAFTLRVVLDDGLISDTLVREFAAAHSDSVLADVAARVRVWPSGRPEPKSDTGLDAQARQRVIAALVPRAAPLPRPIVTVSVVGPNDTSELLGAMERHFRALPVNGTPPRATSPATHVGRQHRLTDSTARQVTIVAGLPGVSRNHPDRRALELLNYIVGVPWYGGRLGWALTKTGLTYSSAATSTFGLQSGYILLTTECDTRNTESVIQAITEVVAGIGARGVEDWELREAQAFTLGRTLLYGAREDSPHQVIARALSTSEETGVDLLDLPALSRAYLSVTLADLNRVAREYYRPERLTVAAMGALPAAASPRIFPDGTFRALFEP